MPNTIEYVGKVDLKYILEKLKDEIDKGGGGGTGDYNQLTNLPSINNIEIKGNKTLQEYGGANYFKGTTAEVLEHYGITSIDDIPEGNITTITDIEPESSDVTADEIDYIAPYKDEEEVSNVKEGLDYLFKGEFWDVDNRIHKVTKEYMYYKNDEYSDPFYRKSSIYIRSRSNNVLCKQTNTRSPGQVGTQIAPSYKRDNGYMDKSGHYYIGEFTIYRFDLPESNKYYTFYTLAGTDDLIIYLDMPLSMEINNKQDASTAITTDNISQQSVAHATTADSATTATRTDYASILGSDEVLQDQAKVRYHLGTPRDNYGATFFQQDIDNLCVNVGIDGAGAVGVNKAKTADSATTANAVNTANGSGIWQDAEGGNLQLISPNGNHMQMDMHNNDSIRIYSGTPTAEVEGVISWSKNTLLNLDTVITTGTTAGKGSATQPVYFNANGVPVACTYSLEKSVPSDAKFTDTTYTSQSASSGSSTVSLCTRGEKYTWNNKADKAGSTSQDFSCKTLTVGSTTINIKYGNYTGCISQQGNQHTQIKPASGENYTFNFGVANNSSSSDKAWSFYPSTSDIVLGTASLRWGQIYSTKSTIATSDREEKKNITIIDKAKEFIMKLKPVSYMFNNATADRHHYGFIAQDVEEAMNELDMTSIDFGGLCKDLKEGSDDEYIYGLRYEEFIAPLVATVQQQQKEIDELKSAIEELKTK